MGPNRLIEATHALVGLGRLSRSPPSVAEKLTGP